MISSAHQKLWRESLRQPSKSKTEQPIACRKLERHSLRTSVMDTMKPVQKSSIALRNSLNSKQFYSKPQDNISTDCSKIESFHREILKHYKEVIKKQEQDLTQVAFENEVLEKKIENLRNARGSVLGNSSLKQLDSEEKVLNYYKNSIQAAENLIKSMKNEFSSRMVTLIHEKSHLEAEISYKQLEKI